MGRSKKVIKCTDDLINLFQLAKAETSENSEKECKAQGSWIVKLPKINFRSTKNLTLNSAKTCSKSRRLQLDTNCLFSNDKHECDSHTISRTLSFSDLRFLARHSVGHDLEERKVLGKKEGKCPQTVILCDKHWEMIESGLQLEQLIQDLKAQLKVITVMLVEVLGKGKETIKVKEEQLSEAEDGMVECLFLDSYNSDAAETVNDGACDDSMDVDPLMDIEDHSFKQKLNQVDLDFCEIGPCQTGEPRFEENISCSENAVTKETPRPRRITRVKTEYHPSPSLVSRTESTEESNPDNKDWADTDVEGEPENCSDGDDDFLCSSEGECDSEQEDDNKEETSDEEWNVPKRTRRTKISNSSKESKKQPVAAGYGEQDSHESEISQDEVSKPKRKRQRKINPSSREYKDRLECLICETKFCSALEKQKHCSETYGEASNFRCPVCQEVRPKLKTLNEHYRKQHTVPIYQFPCRKCPEAFILPIERYKHEQHCRFEKKKAVRKEAKSRRIAYRARKECPVCWKKFPTSREKLEHLKSYGEPPNVRCPACSKISPNFVSMNDHYQRAHTVPIFSYVCRVNCSEAFHNVTVRKRHEQHCTTGLVECPICKKKYLSLYYLRIHANRYHNPEKDPEEFKRRQFCEMCGNDYRSITDLKAHQKKVHFKTHKKPECEFCGKKLSDAHSLKKHVLSQHMKSYQFKCQVCGSESLFKSHLAAHMRNSHKELSEDDIEEMLASCQKVRDNTFPQKRADAATVSLDAIKRKKSK